MSVPVGDRWSIRSASRLAHSDQRSLQWFDSDIYIRPIFGSEHMSEPREPLVIHYFEWLF